MNLSTEKKKYLENYQQMKNQTKAHRNQKVNIIIMRTQKNMTFYVHIYQYIV